MQNSATLFACFISGAIALLTIRLDQILDFWDLGPLHPALRIIIEFRCVFWLAFAIAGVFISARSWEGFKARIAHAVMFGIALIPTCAVLSVGAIDFVANLFGWHIGISLVASANFNGHLWDIFLGTVYTLLIGICLVPALVAELIGLAKIDMDPKIVELLAGLSVRAGSAFALSNIWNSTEDTVWIYMWSEIAFWMLAYVFKTRHSPPRALRKSIQVADIIFWTAIMVRTAIMVQTAILVARSDPASASPSQNPPHSIILNHVGWNIDLLIARKLVVLVSVTFSFLYATKWIDSRKELLPLGEPDAHPA